MIKYGFALLLLFYGLAPLEVLPAAKMQAYQVSLYYSPKCPYSQKVLAYLMQAGIQISLRNVLQDPSAKSELQAYGGYLIVPCLVVNGKAIYDANDIIGWLSSHRQDLTPTQ